MSLGRFSGVVCHLDEATNYAEIACAGKQPVSVDYASLSRIGAARLGTAVSFEYGNIPAGPSGAVAVALVP